jgi:site-specific DNA-methyltransferase (adenine-specific)
LPQRAGIVIRVEQGDCLEVIPRLVAEGVTVDAIVTDPPYGLEFMGKEWDKLDGTWPREALTILRPGGFLLAFGGTRTHHRIACAIEDAGFVIQDTVAWLYGSGFPKHRSHLKPAFEPICLAYKPGGERTMQVAECRIGIEPTIRPSGVNQLVYGSDNRKGMLRGSNIGRWPANVCHDGSDEVLAAFPESKGQQGVVDGQASEHNVYGSGLNKPRARFVPRADAGSAARFFYGAKADTEDRWGSRHPTVKPVELIRWLVALVTPPGGLVLDPFAGSGTTAVAALATGRNAILIEQDEGYVADIRERLAHYEGEGRHSLAAKNRNRRESVGTLL